MARFTHVEELRNVLATTTSGDPWATIQDESVRVGLGVAFLNIFRALQQAGVSGEIIRSTLQTQFDLACDSRDNSATNPIDAIEIALMVVNSESN